MWHVLSVDGQTPSVKVRFAQEKQLILATVFGCLTPDQDDSVSRLIRQALLKTHPEIFDRGDGTDDPFISTKY